MKNTRFPAVCAALLAVLLLSGCARPLPIGTAGINPGPDSAQISLEQARKTALEHAGVKSSDVRWDNSELDFDNGRYVYELEFKSGRTEYSYDVDAATGQILKSEKDFDD